MPDYPPQMTRPTLAEIRRAAALVHGIPESEINAKRRTAHLVDARQDAWIASRDAGYSLPQIAAAWGRDHTTVLHGTAVRPPHADSAATAPMVAALALTFAAARSEMVAELRASPRMSQAEITSLLAKSIAAQDAIAKLAARATKAGHDAI